MKLILLLLSTSLILSCGKQSNDKIIATKRSISLKPISSLGYTLFMEEDFPFVFECDGLVDTIRNNNDFRRIDLSVARCISDKAFFMDKDYENQLIFILENSGYPILISKYNSIKNKFRGKKLFEILLRKANNFECYRDHDGNFSLSINSIYETYLKEMIESIDGTTYDYYLSQNTVWPDNLLDIINSDEHNNCLQLIAEHSYSCLLEAYNKGLVKLKNYGEK
jgi:hypothetical protein